MKYMIVSRDENDPKITFSGSMEECMLYPADENTQKLISETAYLRRLEKIERRRENDR